MSTKKGTIKYDIICGEGQHRSYTACLAELIMLNKYGNQQDYFWRGEKYDEYVKLIKLAGRIVKKFGSRDKFAYFLYKNPSYKFESDIGLVIYNLKGFKYKEEFTLLELVTLYKHKFRPEAKVIEIVEPELKVSKNTTLLDFMGDI